MARQRATLTALPAALTEALQNTLALKPNDDGQRTAQREIVSALHTALDARRQRIIGDISVGPELLKQVIASEAMVGTSR